MSQGPALITGATGFIGSFLRRELHRRGFDVVAVGRQAADGVRCVDLGDIAAVRRLFRETRPGYVFHLAGMTRGGGYAESLAVNCGLASVLLDAALSEGCSETRFLLVGTAAEYGIVGVDGGPVTEDRRPEPVTAYGATKLAQTEVGLTASRRGMRVVVVRPSNVIGPGMPEGLALGSFGRQLEGIRTAGAEPILRVGDLSAVRDFVDVRDVASAMADLAGVDQAFGRVVNISSGRGFQVGEALDALIRAYRTEVKVVTENRRFRPGEAARFVASSGLLASLIHYQPRDLDETMRFFADPLGNSPTAEVR